MWIFFWFRLHLCPVIHQMSLGPDPGVALHVIIQHAVKNSLLLPVGILSWIPGAPPPPHPPVKRTTVTHLTGG